MELFDLPHAEARKLLACGAPVYLPVNPVEYHGPHLSLRNDALISDGLIRDLHERLASGHPEWPLLRASPIELGVEPCPGPGSRHSSYRAVRAAVREACRALSELGARRLILMTFHGAPLHAWALEAGVELCARLGIQSFSPLNLILEELLDADGSRFPEAFAGIAGAAEREEMMRGLAQDFHAGFFETSMALHYAPETVSPIYRDLPPCPPIRPEAKLLRASRAARALGCHRLESELRLAAVGTGWNALRPFPGYTGRPHRATSEAGAVFARAIVERYAERAEAIFAGAAQSPTPILRWILKATLGGRLTPAPVPVGEVGLVTT